MLSTSRTRAVPGSTSRLRESSMYFTSDSNNRARIEAHAPWNYYAIVLAFLCFLTAALAGDGILAGGFAFLWLGLTLHFTYNRLRATKHTLGHVLEMLWTSMLIPPLSIFWRLVGAVHYRVLFF
jgi:hypothetical protein